MAALADPPRGLPDSELQNLSGLRAPDLETLLQEETAEWRGTLDWDFEKSAELVRKFVDLRVLNGWALMGKEGVLGYAYYVDEDQKGLIGDVYVRPRYRSVALEQRLLNSVLDEMLAQTSVTRIESQLMMLTAPLERPSCASPYCQIYPREYLSLEKTQAVKFPARALSPRLVIGPWLDTHQESAAHLIARSYREHVDSLINDQYRSSEGARRFLYNIVQYPGCGTFHAGASLAAFERDGSELAGICLVSMVGAKAGHITQICVAPEWQGKGLGYELIRRSIAMLWEAGCARISLTVTSENRKASALYRELGFQPLRHFAAYVWEGW